MENNGNAVAVRTGTDIQFDPHGKLRFSTYAAVLDFTGQLVAAGMAPKGKTKEQCAICIAFGLPMGLDVLSSIQNIAVINGMPCIWGDALVGLVMASGLLDDIKTEYLPSVKECGAVQVTVKRKGVASPFVGMFSRRMAKTAGLWGKQGPWTQYPTRMMLNRARAFALRDAFPDVLKGIKIAEEVMDTVDITDSVTVTDAPYNDNGGDRTKPKPKPKPATAASLIDAASGKGEGVAVEAAKPKEAQPADKPAEAAATEAPANAENGEPF